MRTCHALLIYLVVSVFDEHCEGFKMGDPGVCEKRIPTIYQKLRRENCANNQCKKSKVKYITTVSCCSKWEFDDEKNICQPICNPSCVNGRCAAPDVCACDPPFVLQNNSICRQPKCEPPCYNSQCVADSSCSCNSDFVKINNTHCGPNCKTGYHLNPITMECTLTCKEHFKLSADGTQCISECNPGCVNGRCIGPNLCECLEGYMGDKNNTKYSKTDGKCIPYCSKGCVNGTCTQPEICTCNPGYKANYSDNSSCRPQCENCDHGECVKPNVCQCHKGFTNSSQGCEPKCASCDNGTCVAPSVCICKEGYNVVHGKCVPLCEKSCINGYCISPNECVCQHGYVQNERYPHICYKVCEDKRRCLVDGCCEKEPIACDTCKGSCYEGICACADISIPCYTSGSELQVSNTSLAGIELTWILAAAIGFLLVTALVVVIVRMHRRQHETKSSEGTSNDDTYGSVLYAAPDMLITGQSANEKDDIDRTDINLTFEHLLPVAFQELHHGDPLV